MHTVANPVVGALLDGRALLVSATPAPTAGGAEVERADVVTQMSLELGEPDQ